MAIKQETREGAYQPQVRDEGHGAQYVTAATVSPINESKKQEKKDERKVSRKESLAAIMALPEDERVGALLDAGFNAEAAEEQQRQAEAIAAMQEEEPVSTPEPPVEEKEKKKKGGRPKKTK